jgi:hypothetical protein
LEIHIFRSATENLVEVCADQTTKIIELNKPKQRKVGKKLLTAKVNKDLGGGQLEGLKRNTKDILALPHEEYMEFLRDLRDILNYHKDYFLSKVTIYFNRVTQQDIEK